MWGGGVIPNYKLPRKDSLEVESIKTQRMKRGKRIPCGN